MFRHSISHRLKRNVELYWGSIIINQKKEKQVIPQCTPEKEEAIMDALRHFKMI